MTFSYDGTLVAWQDDGGGKVAGAPNLAAGTQTCALSAPPRVISATGRAPHLGGADPAAWSGAGGGATTPPGGTTAPGGDGTAGGGQTPGDTGSGRGRAAATLALRAPAATTRAALRKGLVLTVRVPHADRVDATATSPAKVADRVQLRGADLRVLRTSGSQRGARVVARGTGHAKRAAWRRSR